GFLSAALRSSDRHRSDRAPFAPPRLYLTGSAPSKWPAAPDCPPLPPARERVGPCPRLQVHLPRAPASARPRAIASHAHARPSAADERARGPPPCRFPARQTS